jgi:flagellar basal body rod protein FlgB
VSYGFIGRVSSANQLKEALDMGSQRVRAIADRVSKASLQNQDGFALPNASMPAPGQAAQPGATASGIDIETEMTNLADAQLRFEATSKLLSKAYAQIRTSLRDR